jgi:hypothetical protein
VEAVANAGIMALASMFVGILPLAMGIVYAIWPTEQRLTLVRTLSLAAVFATLAGQALGLVNELRFMIRTETFTLTPQVAAGLSESLVTMFVGFGCLTITWLCVTLGLWRRP